jgi:hypothetical protein
MVGDCLIKKLKEAGHTYEKKVVSQLWLETSPNMDLHSIKYTYFIK